MKFRIISLMSLVAVLAIVYFILSPSQGATDAPIEAPASSDGGFNGLGK